MAPDFLSAILMTLVTAAPDTAGQTVKSIDRQGTVAYSGKGAEPTQVIQDRISVIGPDPYFAKAAADLRERERLRAEYEERDWQRRLQALMYLQTVPTFASASNYNPYPPDWAYSSTYPGYYGGAPLYYGGAFVARRPVQPIARPPAPPHASHHSGHSGGRGR